MEKTARDLHPALRRVFASNGYAGASIARLAAASELGKASLYHHFPGGKADMARALIRDAVSVLQRSVFGAGGAESDPKSQLETLLEEFASYVDNGRSPCLLALFALENAEALDRDQLASQFESWQHLVSAQFEALGDSPKAARRRAERLLADLYGFLCMAMMRNDPTVFSRGIKQLRREIRKG